MRLALDTNVLAYAEGVNDPESKASARALLASLVGADVLLPIQAAGELFRVLVRKAQRSPSQAAEIVPAWQALFVPQPTTGGSRCERYAARGPAPSLDLGPRDPPRRSGGT